MKNLKNLERAESFFITVQQKRKLAFILPIPLVVALCILGAFKPGTAIFGLLLAFVILAGCFELLWLSTYLVLPLLNRMRKTFFKKTMTGGPNHPQAALSASTRLTVQQKNTALNNLRELKKFSEASVKDAPDSYLRIQWMKAELAPETDSIRSWTKDYWRFRVPFNGEQCYLTIGRVIQNGHERVFADWTSTEAGYIDKRNAEKIELIKDVPAAFSYGMLREYDDGTVEPHEELICVVTWIGGV